MWIVQNRSYAFSSYRIGYGNTRSVYFFENEFQIALIPLHCCNLISEYCGNNAGNEIQDLAKVFLSR